MTWIALLGSTTTLASFVLFIGIVVWACSSRRRAAFAVAANAPFALPDEPPAETTSTAAPHCTECHS